MKKWFTKVLAFVLAVTLAWVPVGDMGSVQAAEGDAVTIPDAAFKAFLLEEVGKEAGDVLTEGDLAGLWHLRLDSDDGISDLTGLEYCVNLTSLNVYYLSGVDLSPISSLTKLETLNLSYLDITSLPDCSAMTNLKYVDSCYNESLTDISGLANCTTLIEVDLEGCSSLKDISPLKNKLSLTALDLEKVVIDESNKTSYMETISSLTNLTTAYFNYCDMKDEHVSMFAPLTNLKYLELGYCNISNVSWLLSHKDKMEHLTLHGNGKGLVDIATLGQMTNLSILGVSGTGITDFTFISKLPKLTSASSRWANQWAPATTHTYIYRAIDKGGTISIPNFIKNDKGNLIAPNASEYYTYNAATNEIVVPSTSIHSTWGDLQENPVFEFEMTSNTEDTLQVKTTMHVNLLMITSEFEDVELDVGENRTFTASTSANMRGDTPSKTYRWYKDGVLIPGANEYKLQLTNAQLSDAGEYTAEVLWIFEDGSHETVSTSKSFTVSVTNPIVPLEITTHPRDTAIIEGRSGSLTVAAQGEGELTYQWYKGDDAISGATSATYNITNMTADKAGTYKVVVTDSLTSATSNEVSVTMEKELKITSQPTSLTLIEGESGSLSVTAEGEGDLTYQWYHNGSKLTNGRTATLRLSDIQSSQAGRYYVVVTDKNGSVNSSTVTVTVEEALEITTQPTAITKLEGEAGSLSVNAIGEGTLTYQWYKDGVAITGATEVNLEFDQLAQSDEGKYKVVVTDTNGSITSSEVTVTVYQNINITKQPQNITMVEGNSGSLSVTASGEGTLSYQWYKDDVAVEGATAATLSFAALSEADAGNYWVKISDTVSGSVINTKSSNTAVVTVHEKLVITQQPVGIKLVEGNAASLSVTATGQGTLSYQWYKGDEAIAGATSATLNFSSLAMSNAGKYKVEVSDVNGTLTSSTVEVVVYNKLEITKQPVGFTVVEGTAKSLTVEAEGDGTLSYQWYKGDAAIEGATTATLSFAGLAETDEGSYTVVVRDRNGSVTSAAAQVVVHNKLEITKQPAGFTKVEGEADSLTVEAEGEGTLSYQWYKDNTKLDGMTEATLSFASLAETDEGSYTVEVSDVNGKVTSTAVKVVVYNKLEITKQPTGFTMIEGNQANLAVEADGEGTLTYQWYKDGEKLDGETKVTVSFASLALANAGEYKVVVTDSTGSSLTSDVVNVTVHNKLEITTQPVGINLIEGKSGSLTVVAEGEGALSYQWYKDETKLEGATSATLSFSGIVMSDAGSYTVEVSDRNGTVTSTAVTVVVYNQLAISKQPTGITLVEGKAGSLTVEAMGEGELSYQWYKDGVKLNGANAANLNFAAIEMADAGSYTVEVSDSIGSKVTSSAVTVVVQNALEITKQPAGITLVEGNAASLTVEAEGEGNLSYQWYKGESAMEGAASATLSFSSITMADAGSYTVKVSDLNGSVTSTAANVVVQNKLEITKQPTGITVIEGNTGSLTVEAEGEGTLKFQWYKDEVALNGETKATLSFSSIAKADAGNYKVTVSDVNGSVTSSAVAVTVQTALKITTQPAGLSLLVGESGTLTVAAVGEGTLSYQWYKGDAEISGATSASLELKNVTEADEAAYTVKVTDQNGSIVSSAANVVVDKNLKITKQPEALDVLVGSTASLTVEAEGEGTLTYQWYKGDTAIEGATNTALSWENISHSDAGTYKVVVTDKNGSVNSNEVAVAVDKRLAITKQPMGITLVEGNSGSLTVEAEGAGTLKYQWYKGDEAVAGANKASFALNAAEMADAGTYKVEVSDDNGKVVSTAVTVTVQNALEITKQPAGLTLIEGNSGSLTVEAEGEGELSYQWYKDGVAVVTPAVFALNGAGSATLELSNVTLSDAGNYKVVITDSNGSITSSEAVVVVEKKLAITKQQISLSIIEGQNGSLTVEATGAGEMTYQWYKNDVIVEGANSAVYALNNAQLTDAGLYKVVITDKNGTITSSAITVTIQNALKIVKQPEGFTLKTGESGTLQIMATGEGTLTYQWFKNGVAIEGANSSSLNLANLNLTDAGEYKVVVSDTNSSLTSDAVIVIVEAVVVYEEPAAEPAPAPAPVAIAPKTGETAVPVAMAAMAVLTLLGVVIMRKKKEQM